jgi:putative membrane protein
MLWIKALHVIFMVTWFAGLFYLPRLFVYHADTRDEPGIARFKIMERRLLVMMNLGMTLTATFGVWLLTLEPGLLALPWMHAKLGLVAGLLGYHLWCWRLVVAFAEDRNAHTSKWYRYFNEAPTLVLVAVVILVIVRPFQ